MILRAIVPLWVMMLLAGCKKQREASANPSSGAGIVNTAAARASASTSAVPTAPAATLPPREAPTDIPLYSDPPSVDVGMSVEQAYAAIPHRRTVWVERDSSVPPEEKAYLRVIFQVVDEAIAVRVTGLQSFSSERFDSVDVDGQFDRLISFARTMPVPARLTSYHNDILTALSSDRQFFSDWKSQGVSFPFAQQIAGHASVQAASAAAHAAYGELMSKYPSENAGNKDAFFDYHCALDFL
jgi:hypothetical protein